MPNLHRWRGIVQGAVLAGGSLVAAAQSVAQAPAGLMVVTDSPQALVRVAVLPEQYSKARGIPLQVQIEGREGAALLLPGGVQAASAMALLQVRCPSGVWAIEKLLAYGGAQGSGTVQVVGSAPSDQLMWNRLAGSPQASAPGLLVLWMEMATAKVCASQKPPSRW